jgi:hypothetical protein
MSVLKSALGCAIVLAVLVGEARAQVSRPGPAARAPWLPHGLAPTATAVPARSVAPGWMPAAAGAPLRPYSYYAARPPLPARYYWGYGTSDFPFHGRAYGRPYDLWTWPYISGNPTAPVTRYYYPPLG